MAAAARAGRSRRFGGLAARREPAGHVVGYGECACFDICGGNTCVRAREVTGDPWQEDSACYMSDDEIGVEPGRERVKTTPYTRIRSVA